MKALIVDIRNNKWEKSKGFVKADIAIPQLFASDKEFVIIKVAFAGVCGSDKGIWYRTAFGEQIQNSLKVEKKSYRIIGHEFSGDVVDVGGDVKKKYGLKPGDFVSAESHVVCNKCYQCRRGQKNVCINEKILGISYDGCFAEYIKVPAHIVWRNNPAKIRPEIAAVQEPFGNAVHAASKTVLKGENVVISGLGPIGMFLLLAVRGLGAKKVIGLEPNLKTIAMARKLGIDEIIRTKPTKDYYHDATAVKKVLRLTAGIGADVSFEMAGFNSSVNNTIFATRRGGQIILFGIKSGDAMLENYNQFIVRGQTLHAVIGRQVFTTWQTTKRLMENKNNGIQNAIWNVILNHGRGTILPIDDYTPTQFEHMLAAHPKVLIKF